MRKWEPLTAARIRKIREATDLTQVQFCETYNFSLGTFRQWEQGNRRPCGAADVCLRYIEEDPKYMAKIAHAVRVAKQ